MAGDGHFIQALDLLVVFLNEPAAPLIGGEGA